MADDNAAAAAETPKGVEENESKTKTVDKVDEAATEPATKPTESSTSGDGGEGNSEEASGKKPAVDEATDEKKEADSSDSDVKAADGDAATDKKTEETEEEKPAAAEDEDPMEEDEKEEKTAEKTEEDTDEKEETTTDKIEEVKETGRGQRVRKSTVAYQPIEEAKKEVKIPKGKGEKLGDIPNVVKNFKNITMSDPHLKMLHTLLIGGRGKKKEFKDHLFQFSGLIYTEGKEEEGQDKVKEKMYKLTMPELKAVMDLVDVDRAKVTGKEPLCQIFVEWLENPTASGKEHKSPAAKKRKSTGSAKGGSTKKAKKTTPKKAAKKVTPAKKATSVKKPKPTKKAITTKKAAAKSPVKAKAKAKSSAEEVDLNIPGVDIDKVREKVKNIVDNADREELTVKGVRKLLEDWLDTDLSKYKDAVRSLVMEVM